MNTTTKTSATVLALRALTGQELGTVLAALRFYQDAGQGEPDSRSDGIQEIATNGGTETSLDSDGIDDLCERLNLGEIGAPSGLLQRCEDFIAGFEDDDDQEGIPALLADLRAALREPLPALPLIVVELDGGTINCVTANCAARVIFLDTDTEGGDEDQITEIDGTDFYVSEPLVEIDAEDVADTARQVDAA